MKNIEKYHETKAALEAYNSLIFKRVNEAQCIYKESREDEVK